MRNFKNFLLITSFFAAALIAACTIAEGEFGIVTIVCIIWCVIFGICNFTEKERERGDLRRNHAHEQK